MVEAENFSDHSRIFYLTEINRAKENVKRKFFQ